ncbi:DUF1161 domain-containing protein [Tahibacter amnicola]|uniref:DUF1161 domain-containing protein n=1 Tax=Tahibacter amnicola TaxID=2976241 RepID=A0ABY6BEW5_9GAMM|nr:DUF1161 domain-containing protein [Tahibacter amnicola]UXI66895.1 DUF1161 domain-containing protein [Tahibacter amnicola]
MKLVLIVMALVVGMTTVPAFARKPCEELKQEIALKLDTKGVKNYTLEVVAKDAEDQRKTVGTCNGGADRIVYQREVAAQQQVAKQ